MAYAGFHRGKRTLTWTLNAKPTTGDGGLVWRAAGDAGVVLLLNVEATYKLYSRSGTYTAITVVSGTPVAPADGDIVTITDDGVRITVSVNGGASVVYDTQVQGGAYIGFRNSAGGGMRHDSIVVSDT